MVDVIVLPEPYHSRFWSRVDKTPEDGCWHWTGCRQTPTKSRQNPYGVFGVTRAGLGCAQMQTHRLSWMLHFGPIPAGMHVCHSCDVPFCVNPDHLWLGTHRDNMKDMWTKDRVFPERRGGKCYKPGILGVPNLTPYRGDEDHVRVIFQALVQGVRFVRICDNLEEGKKLARNFFAKVLPGMDLTPYQ